MAEKVNMMNLSIQTNPTQSLHDEAHELRKEILEVLYQTGGGHYGGCLSVIDLLLTLYRTQIKCNPAFATHPNRDRLILSKGHAALALYAVLKKLNFHQVPLDQYADFDSPLEGHPDMTALAGIDFSTGSLGQGLSVALGMAYSLPKQVKIWTILGDGECQEGQVWEAAMLAGNMKTSNLKAVVDNNHFQEWGWAEVDDQIPPPVSNFRDKWQAFGWHVIECDGHNFDELIQAFQAMGEVQDKPVVLIANTIKGKGVPLIEKAPKKFHCNQVDQEEHTRIMQEYRS
ncbi:transketolase [Pseudoalteromonas sp. MMG013]|uniref:transketolase n=1 Tax=Pseudoalteromonas sp. MMG013 TaxID=2822687 RepID=UPI001B35A5A8|nr:transketolase [Pseudoalteromonas sp. MMG013]MBQ4862234.1 transketolase [Pseudoalteromonas sp. MMG013]